MCYTEAMPEVVKRIVSVVILNGKLKGEGQLMITDAHTHIHIRESLREGQTEGETNQPSPKNNGTDLELCDNA